MKTNVRDTSLESYDRLLPELPNRERQIMNFLHQHPGQSFSRSEIAWFTGMPTSGVCGRVNALIAKGYLSDESRKICSITRKNVHAVLVAAPQLPLFLQ